MRQRRTQAPRPRCPVPKRSWSPAANGYAVTTRSVRSDDSPDVEFAEHAAGVMILQIADELVASGGDAVRTGVMTSNVTRNEVLWSVFRFPESSKVQEESAIDVHVPVEQGSHNPWVAPQALCIASAHA